MMIGCKNQTRNVQILLKSVKDVEVDQCPRGWYKNKIKTTSFPKGSFFVTTKKELAYNFFCSY